MLVKPAVIPMETIRAMARMIGERFHPQRVILFGSYARGEAGVDSDVDLLVVMDSTAPRFEQSTPLRLAISERWTEPVDVIVRSPEVFERRRHHAYTLEFEANREGVVLYEQA
jgi:predicted nucleotidyltransferase